MGNILGKKTKVLLESKAAVPADDEICCGCGCLHTEEDCVEVKFEGFASNNAKCSECDCYGDSTYILRRGVGVTTGLPPPDTPPTVLGNVRADRGSGAELSVSLEPNGDGSYSIASVDVVNGGSRYDRTAEFAYNTGPASVGYLGDPIVKITTSPTNPTVTVKTPGTSSAVATLVTTAGKAVWGVSKIQVVNVGTGVSEGEAVSLSTPTGYADPHATAFCLETHGQATVAAHVSSGSGAELSVELSEPSKDEYGRDVYSVASVSVVSGGAGYIPEIATASINPTNGTAAVENAVVRLSFATDKPVLEGRILQNGFLLSGVFSVEYEPVGVDSYGRTLWGITRADVLFSFFGDSSTTAYIDYDAGQYGSVESAQLAITRDQNGVIAAINVTRPGKYYATRGSISGATVIRPGLYRRRTGGLHGVVVTSAGAYYGSGPVTKADVIDGGKFWNVSGNCLYLYKQCASCPCQADPGDICTQEIELRFSPGMRRHSLAGIRHYTYYDDAGFILAGQELILSASVVNTGVDKFTSVTFKAEDFTVADCSKIGSVTVSAADCEDQSKLCCEMPEQISLALSGMGDLFNWSSQNGGAPTSDPFDGQCGVSSTPIMVRQPGTLAGIAAWGGRLVDQDATVILDRVDQPCQRWLYQGSLPVSPSAGGPAGVATTVGCGGDLGGNGVSVSIEPQPFNTTVYIDPPTKGPVNQQATAEITGVDEAGAIAGVSVTFGGSGYAREIIVREEPKLVATVTTKTGSGASLAPILTKVGEDPETCFWFVDGLTVNKGGAGYHPDDFVVISCEDCADQPDTFASIVLDRQVPDIQANVAGGSGAALSVTLVQETGFDGAAVWLVATVSVEDGGDGYADGAPIAFSIAKNDVQIFAAEAIAVNKTAEPTLGIQGSATVGITLASNGGSPEAWGIATVEVVDGGAGYSEGESLVVTASQGDNVVTAAQLTARTILAEPTVSASVVSFSGGSGAQLEATLATSTDSYGRTIWSVDQIAVISGGAGYSNWDYVVVAPIDGAAADWFFGWPAVDQDGAITGVSIYSGGVFYKDTGVLLAVDVQSGGAYSHPTGVIERVQVLYGGSYYKTNGSIQSAIVMYNSQHYWREVATGEVTADAPSVLLRSYTGSGASAEAVVDTDLSSGTFGQIAEINVTDGGQDYLEGGVGWVLSIGVPGLFHREALLGIEKEPEPDQQDQRACANYFDRYSPYSVRAAYTNCPIDLLSKTYKMGYATGSPFGDPTGDDLEEADWCHTITYVPTFFGPIPTWAFSFFSFGNGDITVALSPVEEEEEEEEGG